MTRFIWTDDQVTIGTYTAASDAVQPLSSVVMEVAAESSLANRGQWWTNTEQPHNDATWPTTGYGVSFDLLQVGSNGVWDALLQRRNATGSAARIGTLTILSEATPTTGVKRSTGRTWNPNDDANIDATDTFWVNFRASNSHMMNVDTYEIEVRDTNSNSWSEGVNFVAPGGGGQQLSDTITNSLPLTDDVAIQQAITREVTNPLDLTDDVQFTTILAREIVNDLALTDTVETTQTIFVEITDNLGLTDDVESTKSDQLFLRDTQTELNTGGDVFDLSANQGPTPSTLTSATPTSDAFQDKLQFFKTIDDTIDPDTVDFPCSINMVALDSNAEWRWRVERRSSAGVFQEGTNFSTVHTTAGIKIETLSFASPPPWAAGDQISVSLQIRETLVIDVTMTVGVNDPDSFVDATFLTGVGAQLSNTIINNLALSDDVATTQVLEREEIDDLTLTDDVQTTQSLTREQVDSLALTDDVKTQATINREVTDDLSLTDEVATTQQIFIELIDSLALTDDATGELSFELADTVIDSLALTDSVTASRDLRVEITDSLALSDSVELTRDLTLEIEDALALADAIERTATNSVVVVSQLGLTDSVERAVEGPRTTLRLRISERETAMRVSGREPSSTVSGRESGARAQGQTSSPGSISGRESTTKISGKEEGS